MINNQDEGLLDYKGGEEKRLEDWQENEMRNGYKEDIRREMTN